jgi:hypothetical protein
VQGRSWNESTSVNGGAIVGHGADCGAEDNPDNFGADLFRIWLVGIGVSVLVAAICWSCNASHNRSTAHRIAEVFDDANTPVDPTPLVRRVCFGSTPIIENSEANFRKGSTPAIENSEGEPPEKGGKPSFAQAAGMTPVRQKEVNVSSSPAELADTPKPDLTAGAIPQFGEDAAPSY